MSPKALCLALLLTTLGLAAPPRPVVGRLIRHVTQPGEDLAHIAARYRLSVDHLAYANGFPITVLEVEPGTPLWIPACRVLPANPPSDGIVVNLPERMLFLFRQGRFDSYFPISIGDEAADGGRFQTPTGSFRIIEKLANPTWYPPAWAPDRRPVPPGPDNPLGERWVGLSLPRTGIHGTNDPLNVGNSVTHGCMRMYPHLLREFYAKVQVGQSARLEYETSKLGKMPDGKMVLVNFPDVYRKSDTLRGSRRLLAQAKIASPRRNFWDVLGLQMGVPIELKARDSIESEFLRRSVPQPQP